MSRSGNRSCISAIASKLIDASSRMAVCGHPPVSTADDSVHRERLAPHQEFHVFLCEDIVRHDAKLIAVAHGLAKTVEKRGLARAHRSADADFDWLSHGQSGPEEPAVNVLMIHLFNIQQRVERTQRF